VKKLLIVKTCCSCYCNNCHSNYI